MRIVALFVAAVLAALANVGAACAHASLIGSEPPDRAVLAQAPPKLKLTFNEPVSPLVLRLVRPTGEIVQLHGATAGDGATIVAALPSPMRLGTHLLSWRVISADGHPVGGALTFSIGQPSETSGAPQASADLRLSVMIWLARITLYLALFFGVGGAFYAAWIADEDRAPTVTIGVLVCGLAAAFFSVGLHGVDVLGLPSSKLRETAVWGSGFASAHGLTLCIAAAALALALAALTAQRPIARWCSALALIGVGTALAASGHAATASPQWVMRPAVFVHGVSIAFWLGALLPLAAALRAGRGRIALARFSKAIPWPLLALVVSAIPLAVVQVREVEALWTTPYGIVLCCKLVAVGGLLALAGFNRWLTPHVLAGDGRSARLMGGSIAAEIGAVALILGLVASWRFTPPPRALLAAARQPVLVHVHSERAMADLQIDRARADGRRIAINLLDSQFRPLTAKEVTLVLSKPDAGIEPLRFDVKHVEATTWQVEGVRLPMSGRWRVRVEILVNEFEKIYVEDDADLSR